MKNKKDESLKILKWQTAVLEVDLNNFSTVLKKQNMKSLYDSYNDGEWSYVINPYNQLPAWVCDIIESYEQIENIYVFVKSEKTKFKRGKTPITKTDIENVDIDQLANRLQEGKEDVEN